MLNEIEIGVGTWAWGDRFYWNYGGNYNRNTVETMFTSAINSGINFFDTAEVYGQGQSELIIGELLRKIDNPVKIATKYFPYPWRFSNKSIARALEKSLERLQVDSVDLYQIHWPFSIISIENMMVTLSELRHSEKILGVGVSNFNLLQTQKAFEALAINGLELSSIQVEYHLLNRQIERNGLLDYCNSKGIRIIAYSPLAQGLLTGKYSPDSPPPGIRARRYANQLKIVNPLIKLLTEIGNGHGNKTPSQVALNWLICKGTLPIPGAKNLNQLNQNNESIGWRLSSDEVSALDKASEGIIQHR